MYEWITSIEFLKTKCVYDKFTQKFCFVPFPMVKQEKDTRKQANEKTKLVESLGVSLKNMDYGGTGEFNKLNIAAIPGGKRASAAGSAFFQQRKPSIQQEADLSP